MPNRKPCTAEKQMRSTDQCMYCPLLPTDIDISTALRSLTYPQITMGLMPHPLKGAALSPTTAKMPNLTRLLNRHVRNQNPRAQYTTMVVSRNEHGGRTALDKYCDALLPITMHIGVLQAPSGTEHGWTIRCFTDSCVALTNSLRKSIRSKLEEHAFPYPELPYSEGNTLPARGPGWTRTSSHHNKVPLIRVPLQASLVERRTFYFTPARTHKH